MANNKIAVGISGGVDSAFAASLLKEKGYEVIGLYFRLNNATPLRQGSAGQAVATAKNLNIKLHEIDLTREFKQKVVNKVLDKYKRGLIPNPCILCNKYVRFPAGLEFAKKHNCFAFATGHYAKICEQGKPRKLNPKKLPRLGNCEQIRLYQAKNKSKDQSYFLYFLKQDQLKHLKFPLGTWKKQDVIKEAEKRNLSASKISPSQDLCFTCNINQFLKNNLKELVDSGKVVNAKGDELGKHRGLAFYTNGQRGGWDWSAAAQKKYSKNGQLLKLYVIKKDIKNNILIVGDRIQAGKKSFKVKIDTWHGMDKKNKLYVKIRSTGKLLEIDFSRSRSENDSRSGIGHLKRSGIMSFTLKSPQLGITPGQAAVFYQPPATSHYSPYIVAGGEIVFSH